MTRNRLFQWEKGQGLVEYALILSLVAVVVIVVLVLLGPAISRVYCSVVVELGSPCEGGAGHYYDSTAESTAACNADGGTLDWTSEPAPDGYYSISCVREDDSVIWTGFTLAG